MKKSVLRNLISCITNQMEHERKIGILALLFVIMALPLFTNANVYMPNNGISAMAVQKVVTGKVTAESGISLPGVSVVVKGTSRGTATDVNGKYEISVEDDSDVLVFSFIGMQTQEITVGTQSVIDVVMLADALQVGEVVVTALGIKREEKSLTYSTQQVKGDELTAVRADNMINALAGKTTGVVISPGTSGVGGSTKVILRGYTSVQGNNQPLYVVDGIPLQNYIPNQAETGSGFGGGVDAGDGISNLNPDDIESINILKGASAAALYGSQAANGVIIITTKSGKQGKTSVKFSSSFQVDKANVLYDWQDKYKASGATSWGAKSDMNFRNNNGENLFETGYNLTNTLSLSGGCEKSQNYVSMSNTVASGIVPTNDLERYNLTLRNTTEFFNGRLNLDSKVNLLLQKMENTPSAPGEYFNPIRAAYLMPVSDNLKSYRDNYEVFNPDRNVNTQNWAYVDDANHQNPYWVFNRVPNSANRSRIIANMTATVKLTNELDVKLRGNIDRTYDSFERKAYAGTRITLSHKNGRYEFSKKENTQYYGDILLSYNKRWDDFSLLATIGTSVTDVRFNETGANSDTKGLYIPNLFSFTNMVDGGKTRIQKEEQSQLQSYFGTASIGYKNIAYLDITARRDKSSTLPEKNNTYYYPSFGASVLINEILSRNGNLPEALDFAKLRASYSEVGNDIPPYVFNPYDRVNETGTIIRNTIKPNPNLKPERTSAYELGFDLRMFDNKARLDFTYYNSTTKDQYFSLSTNVGSGYSKVLANGGTIVNKGIEFSLGLTPVRTNNLEWNTIFNFSTNSSDVRDLPQELIDRDGGYSLSVGDYELRVQEGGEYGEIWASGYKRHNGKLVVTSNKEGEFSPVIAGGDDKRKIGTINPDFRLSWGNDISYKNFRLNFLIDGSFGGDVISYTQTEMNRYGVSAISGSVRDNKGLKVDGVILDKNDKVIDTYKGRISANNYYSGIPVSESIYDATNIRLRELSLSYSLPKSLIQSLSFLSEASLSLTGRNLFFFHINAPYDPEVTQTTSGNYKINSDNFGVPSTRTYGVSLNVTF